jgi:glycosyltransferase involved in cell wall biosynthesis
MYSTLILTLNEESNLPACLDALEGCDDVVVLDSFSSDGTVAIAEARGARVFQRRFDTFAGQRNWAIDNIEFKHPWVLHLDADECLTPALHHELVDLALRDEKSAYLIANKLFFMGRWIKRASMYPFYQARLLRYGESRFTQLGHGQVLEHAIRGVGKVREPYIHHNFSRGIGDWLDRHNRYSADEASRLSGSRGPLMRSIVKLATATTKEQQQQAMKRLADRIPLRPLVRFGYLYFLRLSFLDGRAGFDYCVLMSFFDYLTRLKARENEISMRNQIVGPASHEP